MSKETYPSATYSFPVVILGGGFAGTYCARALSAGLGRNAADVVALVADQNAMLFHPMVAEVSGSSISPLHVTNPVRLHFSGADGRVPEARNRIGGRSGSSETKELESGEPFSQSRRYPGISRYANFGARHEPACRRCIYRRG